MTAITVANTESAIVTALKTSLEDATIKGKAVWKTVAVALSESEAHERLFSKNTPIAVIVYSGTTDTLTVQNVPAIEVSFALILAARLRGKSDESDRLKEGLWLTNAAKNAIESDLPAAVTKYATAWGDANHYQAAIDWGNPDISRPTDKERAPWVVATLPVTIGAVIETTTSH